MSNQNDDRISVDLSTQLLPASPELVFWKRIRDSAERTRFDNFKRDIDLILCPDESLQHAESDRPRLRALDEALRRLGDRRWSYKSLDAYVMLRTATEAFLAANCGVHHWTEEVSEAELPILQSILEDKQFTGDSATLAQEFKDEFLTDPGIRGEDLRLLPYLALIRRKLSGTPTFAAADRETSELNRYLDRICEGIQREKLTYPCYVELIWSYWQEQGMLVQTMNALSRRFQNVRGPAERDPLAMVEIDPLRPLNNLLWGYIQDEQHRLSVVRRAYEYDHHYGLNLEGKVIPTMRTADSRSRFLESFHTLLQLATAFYKQDDDVTVKADPFPVLNALKDLHLILSEGAHNQFGDLPTVARIEMLMQQWLLARPEFREVLPTRTMAAYPEPWMERVDAMKRLQDWDETSITHYNNLAVYGEQLILSVRWGNWRADVSDPDKAGAWAKFWRPQVQGYTHAYRTVTNVDLTAPTTMTQQRSGFAAQPSILIRKRQNGRTGKSATTTTSSPPTNGFRERRKARRATK